MLHRLFLASTLAAFPAQGVSPEKAPLDLARAVPKEAFVLAQARDLDGLRADIESSAWYAFYKDEAMKGLREWIAANIAEEEKGKAKEGAFDVDPWDVLQSIHGSVAFFASPSAAIGEPVVGVLVDPGESRGNFEDFLARILDRQREKNIASSEEYAGVELKLFERKQGAESGKPAGRKAEPSEDQDEDEGAASEAEDPDFQHSAVFESSGATCLVISASREEVLQTAHGMIDRLSGKDASKGIEGNEVLAQARHSVASAGRIETFVDLAKVIEMVREEDPPSEEREKVLDALGVGGLGWLYAGGDLGQGERASFDLALKFPDQGFLRDCLGLLGTISRDTARLAPRESSAVTLAQFDVWGLWQSAWKLAGEIDPETAESARAQMDAALEQFGGGELEQSFLSQLDGRFLSFGIHVPDEEWKAVLAGLAAEPDSGTATSLGNALVVGLENPQEVGRFLQSVFEHVGVSEMVKTEEFQGTTIHRLSLGPGPGFQWAFTKQAAVASQFPSALRAALRMEGAEKKDSALEKESFKPHFETNADAGVLGLTSTPEMLKGFLSGIETMRGVLGASGATVELPPFPSPDAVDRHFKGTLASTVKRTGSVLRFGMDSR